MLVHTFVCAQYISAYVSMCSMHSHVDIMFDWLPESTQIG